MSRDYLHVLGNLSSTIVYKIQENSFVNIPSLIYCPPANTNYSKNQSASHHHPAV